MNDTGTTLFFSKADRKIRPQDTSLISAQKTSNRFPSNRPVDMFQNAPQKIWRLNIREISVPTLLQILANAQRSAVLKVCSGVHAGTIHVRCGKICFASIANAAISFHPHKAFHRILQWTDGIVELEWTEPPYQRDEIFDDVKTLLQENVSKQIQLHAFMAQLPPPQTPLKVVTPPTDINELSEGELHVFEMAMQRKTVQAVLDTYPLPDVETCRLMLDLMNRRFIGELTEPGDDTLVA